jgi:serine/threonine protein kinase
VSGLGNRDLEAAFARIVAQGPESALAALARMAAADPELGSRLEPLVKSHIARQQHKKTRDTDPSPPVSLPRRFRVIKHLGTGGFGHVYHAIDCEYNNAQVAVKVLHSHHSQSLRRFKAEFTELSTIASHENLVRLYEGFFERDPWLFTMEYVEGQHLVDYVRQAETSHRQHRIRSCLVQLAAAVHALHQNRIQHRDLKPSNVLVTAHGRVKVIDFGLVREFSDEFEVPVSLAGTLDYMSPEQLTRSTVTEASDWYAIGVMLYELLTGMKPHAGALAAGGGITPPHRLAEDVPQDISVVCLRLLEHDPRRRASYRDLMSLAPMQEPVALAPRAEEIFVGREVERQQLAEAYRRSRSRPVVIHLSGPSGIGKTALIRQVQADVRRDDPTAIIVAARCHQNRSVAYPSLDDLVDRLARHLSLMPRERVEQILPRHVAALGRMFPVMDQFLSGSHMLPARESAELRMRGFAALGELLGRLSDRYPVVLSIDDLQWGDPDGCRFLKQLMESADAPRLMLVLSYRSDGGDVASFLEKHSAEEDSGHRLTLGLLTNDETHRLALRLVTPPMAANAGVSRQIADASGGNPYLLHEIAEWANSQAATSASLAFVNAEQVLRERIGALGTDARRLLEFVAVAGEPTAFDELRAIGGFDNMLDARDDLRRKRLTRSRVLEGREQIEVYHARVRDAVLQLLAPVALPRLHHDMARALQAAGHQDAERIAIHLIAAGETAASSRYAKEAGDRARHALAFEKAAAFYRLALRPGTLPPNEALIVLTNLAESLANAGRCAEAARVYTEAAGLAERRQHLELTARAADQLLRGGYIREGLHLLDDVMRRLRLKPPRGRAALLARVALLRMRLALRGLRFNERGSGQLSDEEKLRLDVCWTGAMVTSLIDPLRSAESSARYVLLALRSGDPRHVTTALTCEAPLLCVSGSTRNFTKATALLRTATELADRLADPHATARCLLSKALVAFLQGDWRTASRDGDLAADMLRTRCINVAWELAAAQIFAASARYIRGDWAENRRRLPEYVHDAEARGDANVAVSLRVQGCAYLSALAHDQPDEALRQLHQDVAARSFGHADFFRCNVLQAEVDIALYRNDPIRANEVIERDWATLERALLLRNPTTFAFLRFARGRVALAMAAQLPEGARRQALLDRAESDIRALERRGPPWSGGMALALRAGVASWRANRAAVLRYLTDAERAFAAADMQPIRLAVMYHLARQMGDAEQERGVSEVREWARGEGIERFDRIAAALTPGRFE